MDKNFVIFDMDGTLIDSMGYWRDLTREFLVSIGKEDELEEVRQIVAPMTVEESSRFFVERYHMKETPEQVHQSIHRLIIDHYLYDIPLKPGIRELLETLSARGVRMCVATVSRRELMEACLKRCGVLDRFEFVLSCETLHTHKREPAVYLEAARRFGASPGDIAVFEDAPYALETAKKAGFYTVAVYDDEFRAQWPALSAMADETLG